MNLQPTTPIPAPLMRLDTKASNMSRNSHPQHPQANQCPKPAPSASLNSLGEAFELHTNSQQQKQQQQQQQHDITTELHNPDAKPTFKLPDGWECFWSKSQKRWYFFDTKTNKSVWDLESIKATH
jgi:hypothetical protein